MNGMRRIRSYSELCCLKTFEERFRYLQLNARLADETFGFDRWINQKFYKSKEWKAIRNHVIVRDNCCDLGVKNFDIFGDVLVHHMNPIDIIDIKDASKYLLNPEYLISTSLKTHNALHYGSFEMLSDDIFLVERKPNDTIPWKH